MTPEQIVALGKLFSADEIKEAREKVEPGKYNETLSLTITYGMKVGEDYSSKIAQSVPWQRLCIVLFSKLNGVTMDSVVREALENGVDTDEIGRQAKEAVKRLLKPSTRLCKGRVGVVATIKEN